MAAHSAPPRHEWSCSSAPLPPGWPRIPPAPLRPGSSSSSAPLRPGWPRSSAPPWPGSPSSPAPPWPESPSSPAPLQPGWPSPGEGGHTGHAARARPLRRVGRKPGARRLSGPSPVVGSALCGRR
nr:riboflavin kinase isoform X2 [Taeniopygia guttata]